MSFFKEIFGKGTMKGNIRLHNSMKIMLTIVSTIMIIINNFFNMQKKRDDRKTRFSLTIESETSQLLFK
jgi:hypothetical protein